MHRSATTIPIVVASILALFGCSRPPGTPAEGDAKLKKDETQGRDGNAIVIGQQMADAIEIEERRKRRGQSEKSPMPKGRYETRDEELGLLRVMPSRYDTLLRDLAGRFARSTESERNLMRAAINMDEFYTLKHFGARAAVFALREKNPDWIKTGLAAVTMIELERFDWRDAFTPLSLLYHSATRIGTDADQLFHDAVLLAEPGMAKLMDGFLKRPRSEKDIRTSWGYRETETDKGIGFIRSGFHKYAPTTDLTHLAIDIADSLGSDKYRPDLEIGENLPEVWLNGVDDAALGRALKDIRAGALISGQLREEHSADAENQQLTIFLVETSDESTAEKLLKLSRAKRADETHRLGVKRGKLFALLVARSWAIGVKGYETATSIRRFEEPLTALLGRYAAR